MQVSVNTTAPALSPLEIERQITSIVEQSIGGLTGLTEVRSVSKFGLSQVTATFDDDTDVYLARQVVSERLGTLELPTDVGRPSLGPVSSGLGEVFQYIVKSDTASPRELRTLHHWVVRPQMLHVARSRGDQHLGRPREAVPRGGGPGPPRETRADPGRRRGRAPKEQPKCGRWQPGRRRRIPPDPGPRPGLERRRHREHRGRGGAGSADPHARCRVGGGRPRDPSGRRDRRWQRGGRLGARVHVGRREQPGRDPAPRSPPRRGAEQRPGRA